MPTASSHRYAAIDMLRGAAMVWMTLFHFCFDLQHFGYLQANFYNDPFWTLQRTAIVGLFVFCAGLGQSVALQQQQPAGRFWRRWGQIAGCALAVSLGSWFMFPQGYIYFGILHGMAVMLLLARLLGPTAWGRGWRIGLLVALCLLLPALAAQAHAQWPGLEFLNQRTWSVLGLISRKPVTEDYAPLFPWLGVMLLALGSGQWLLRRHRQALARTSGALADYAPLRGLAFLGRWSLSYYMLHQPVLLGLLGLRAWMAY